MRKRLPMTGWYNPIMLVQTGIRVAISTVFGQFADRREAMAAANAIEPQPFDKSFNYEDKSRNGEFWFDFLADTGDGWDSTFAMAQLLMEMQLTPQGVPQPLPRGQVLILGGDQVYPTASREAYDDHFLGPFDEAYEIAPPTAKADMPDLYAIPGNHDWYDGLSAFFTIFCRRRIAVPSSIGINRPGRLVAGRPTNQTRSYFAIKLPGKWWVWGTDSQIKGYIDQPQIDYFQYVASEWMEPGSNLVLCVGQPNWAYVDPDNPDEFETFSYLERLAGMAMDAGGQPKGHQLKLVLTGDSHHYSRYYEGELQYLTCGGGGAFLHPTHQLKDKSFAADYSVPGVPQGIEGAKYSRTFTIASKVNGAGEALFPDSKTSRGLTKGNWYFAFRNWGLTAVFFEAYLLYNWLLNMNARIEEHVSLVHALTNNGAGSFFHALSTYISLSFVSPWPPILFLAAMGSYCYFADEPHNMSKRIKIGVIHGLAQAGAAVLVTSFVIWAGGLLYFGAHDLHPAVAMVLRALIIIGATLVAAVVSGTILGLYLLINLNRYGRHWNEAFSSLAIKHYKSFLRMMIDADGKLHLYPIGLENVPSGGGTSTTLKPHLIEGPITISGPLPALKETSP